MFNVIERETSLPSERRMGRVDGTGDDVGTDGNEVDNSVVERQDFRRTDVGEGERVEDEDQIFSPKESLNKFGANIIKLFQP